MKAILQRVSAARVEVDGATIGRIDDGLLVYVGIGTDDTPVAAEKLADKVAGLRIFTDAGDKLNLSVRDVGGSILAIPNFTLQADARKNAWPSLIGASPSRAFVQYFGHRSDPLGTA